MELLESSWDCCSLCISSDCFVGENTVSTLTSLLALIDLRRALLMVLALAPMPCDGVRAESPGWDFGELTKLLGLCDASLCQPHAESGLPQLEVRGWGGLDSVVSGPSMWQFEPVCGRRSSVPSPVDSVKPWLWLRLSLLGQRIIEPNMKYVTIFISSHSSFIACYFCTLCPSFFIYSYVRFLYFFVLKKLSCFCICPWLLCCCNELMNKVYLKIL